MLMTLATFRLVSRRGLALMAGLTLLLGGCAHKPRPAPPPKPPVLTITVNSAAGLNPDPRSGAPSPVVVRIYQLASASEFMNADFNAIYRNEAATLGKALIAKQELTAFPGERSTQKLELASETRALAVLVAFSNIEHAQWRVTGAANTHPMVLTLGANTVQLAPQD
jgi:type VI secretion system protein VasD